MKAVEEFCFVLLSQAHTYTQNLSEISSEEPSQIVCPMNQVTPSPLDQEQTQNPFFPKEIEQNKT